MRAKITIISALILTAILSVGGIGIGIANLIAFTMVQGAGFLLSQITKKKPSRATVRFLVSAAACCIFLILGTNRRHLWSLYFMLTLPACGLSALVDLFFRFYEMVCNRKEDKL